MQRLANSTGTRAPYLRYGTDAQRDGAWHLPPRCYTHNYVR